MEEIIAYEGNYTELETAELLAQIRKSDKTVICYPRISPTVVSQSYNLICGCIPIMTSTNYTQIMCRKVSIDELQSLYNTAEVDTQLLSSLENPYLAMEYYVIFKGFKPREGVYLTMDTLQDGIYGISLRKKPI